MKGINLKKIGAIVAGAAILASSVAFAGAVFYGNTPLVTDSGQPIVKVVVGHNAAATDGVAAANIAAYLAHEAYKTDTYTAAVDDTACVATNNTGSCVISDKSVTLEVTVPGTTVSGTYTLNNLIGDKFDRTLMDRDQATSSQRSYSFGSDISENANPFTDGSTSNLGSAPTDTSMYKVTGSSFTPLADYAVKDADANKEYTETQRMWIAGNSQYDTTADEMGADISLLAYTMKFSSSEDFGIPVCTKATNTTDYSTCDDQYKTSTHKTKVMFMGEEWIISEMSNPTTSTPSVSTVTKGGHVNLAKESSNGVLNKGEYLSVGNLNFVLDDVSAATGTSNKHPALLKVYENGSSDPIKEGVSIDPATTSDVSVPGYGTYKVHVYKTGPGYSFGTTWADMAVFSNELELKDNSKLDADVGNNDEWHVSLGWKNKEASASYNHPDHLRSIILYTENSDELIGDTLHVGDSVPVVQDPEKWDISYLGLDVGSSDRDNLKFTLYRDSDKSLSDVYANATGQTCNLTAPYIKVSSGVDNAFTLSGDSSKTGYDDTFYIAAAGAVCPVGSLSNGSVLMKLSSNSDYYAVANQTSGNFTDVQYETVGDGVSWTTGGAIRVSDNATRLIAGVSDSSWTSDLFIGLSEDAGVDLSSNMEDKMVFALKSDGTSSVFNFDGGATNSESTYVAKNKVYYLSAGPSIGNGTKEEGYITERGSVYSDTSDTKVSMDVAEKLAHSQLYFSTVESAEATAGATTLTDMIEGESRDVGDVTVKVVEIKATGTCDSGASGTPSCEVSGDTSAYLTDSENTNVGATLDAATMYNGDMNLVVLDNSDVSTGTVISVGGPNANTVTSAAEADGTLDLSEENNVVVTQVGDTIVVAGYTADDTLAAADQFLAGLGQ